jgi:hypothetical protein
LRTLNRDTVPGKKWKSQGCCIVELAWVFVAIWMNLVSFSLSPVWKGQLIFRTFPSVSRSWYFGADGHEKVIGGAKCKGDPLWDPGLVTWGEVQARFIGLVIDGPWDITESRQNQCRSGRSILPISSCQDSRSLRSASCRESIERTADTRKTKHESQTANNVEWESFNLKWVCVIDCQIGPRIMRQRGQRRCANLRECRGSEAK